MKDIFVSQQVTRRSKPQLFNSASSIRFPKPSFIAEQKTGKLFEFFRNLKKRKKNSRIFVLPPQEKRRARAQKAVATIYVPGYEEPAQKTLPFLGPFGRFLEKRVFSLLLFCVLVPLSAFGLGALYVAFIPEPLPPEEDILAGRTAYSGGPDVLELSDEIPLDLTESFSWNTYRVRSGDSVEGIARRFGLSIDAVIASNDIKNVRRNLLIGETIRIPNMDGIPYTVKPGDSYPAIAKSLEVPLEAVLDANDIQNDDVRTGTVLFIPGAKMSREDLRQAMGMLFIYPLAGRQTSPFGWRRDPFTGVRSYHAALDLAAPMGTPIKASGDGRISSVGTNAVYGNFIIISHAGNYQTMYGHLSKILVSRGTYVNQGTIIGRVGSTGRSTGPHLHFAAYKNSSAINPLEILNK
ncbi:MAG: M23 family metallopeptidase [Treponema sp.]|jgi:murein DD-endopeptidase MepM/ murein hydrolase activator NlpD|nr:M23 family metallopeptidase [Treponema sp.]